jgi:beta-mannosidase
MPCLSLQNDGGKMKKLLLNGSWTLESPGLSEPPVPAQVPGSVYNDLLCAGRMPDPFYRDNEMQALALMENDFYYTRTFSVPEDLFDCSELLLRCEGLDTVAEIRINGVTVGRADNMHRTWEYDVREFLKAGENEITVIM